MLEVRNEKATLDFDVVVLAVTSNVNRMSLINIRRRRNTIEMKNNFTLP